MGRTDYCVNGYLTLGFSKVFLDLAALSSSGSNKTVEFTENNSVCDGPPCAQQKHFRILTRWHANTSKVIAVLLGPVKSS